MSRILVTGGTGYVAGWCIVQLLDSGHEVVTTVRAPEREREVRAAVETQTRTSESLAFAVADLSADRGWDDAMSGCDFVLHVASPLTVDGDGESIVRLALDGTLRVLAAAEHAGVKRVVVTSSCAAATPHSSQLEGSVDESCWTDADEPGLSPYRRSKVLAERAAWDQVAGNESVELTTVLPAAVFGPALSASSVGSLGVIAALLDGSAIAIPRLGFEVVDVRDVAAAHVLAMTTPEAAGQRFIVSGTLVWFTEIAATLRNRLGEDASGVPTATLTDDDFRAVAALSPELQTLLPLLGRSLEHSSAKARSTLGWQPRAVSDTVVDSARCLLAFNAAT